MQPNDTSVYWVEPVAYDVNIVITLIAWLKICLFLKTCQFAYPLLVVWDVVD